MYRKSKRINKKKRGAIQICSACLSSDRSLTVFGKLEKVFQQLLDALDLNLGTESLLCWECIAMLKKVYQFKERAKKSQILLSGLDSLETTPEPLSNLKVVAITTTTSHLPIQEADVFVGGEIKIELDDYLNDTVDHNNDILSDDHDESKINLNNPINVAIIYDKNDFYDNKDGILDETDCNDDTEMNTLEEIDEKKSGEYDDLTKIAIMKGNGSDHTHDRYDKTKRGDPDYKCPKIFKSESKVDDQTESSMRKHYKVILRSSLSRYTTKLPITFDDVMVLWEKDKDSEYIRSLDNKCDICLTILEEGLATHKQNVHLEPFSAMDFSSQINKTINWNDCIICQDTREGQDLLNATEYGLKRCLESLAARKMYEDTLYINSYFLLDALSEGEKMHSKIKWHRSCYASLVHKGRIEAKKKAFDNRRALETSEKLFCCQICKSYKDDETTLASHMDRHCFKFQCKICGFETLLSHAINHHFKKNHARNMECLECGAQFRNMFRFRAHFAELHVKFICDYCGKKYYQKQGLVKHIQKHHTPRLCKLCNKEFESDNTYREHMKFTHSVKKSEATFCVTCNIQFDNMEQFTNHVHDNKDDILDEADWDDDTEMNTLEEIDEKESGENVIDRYDKTEREDPDYKCPKNDKSESKVDDQMESSRRRHYKVLHSSLKRYTTKLPITFDDVMVLWEKDKDSEYIRSLDNKCDICLTIVEGGLATHKQNVHLEPFSAMDFSSQINKTINWNDCIICQDTRVGLDFLNATEYSLKRCLESLTARKMYEDTLYINSYFLLDALCEGEKMHSKIKWHRSCYASLVHKGRIEAKKKAFDKRRALETSEKHFCCQICKIYKDDEKTLASHMDRHCFKFQCKICGFETLLSHAINHHFKKNHAKILECLKCGERFGNISEFRAHFADHHVKFICDYCGKKWHNKQKFVKHIQNYHTPRLCKLCNRVLKCGISYRNHMQIAHTVEKSEATYCVTCNVQFDNIQQFSNHVRNAVVHLEEMGKKKKKEKAKCPECPNIYASKKSMMYHYRYVHLKNSKYYCSICDKQFLTSEIYNRHRRSKHENYVPKKDKLCNYCGRGFSDIKVLTHHIRTHTGERPHECSQCDSKFAQKTALVSHVRHVHMKIKRGNSNNYAAGLLRESYVNQTNEMMFIASS